jgi:simple sugar transport system permease protein
VALAGQFVLSCTPFGRQLYAIGANADSARKVGIETRGRIAAGDANSGVCGGLGGLVAL